MGHFPKKPKDPTSKLELARKNKKDQYKKDKKQEALAKQARTDKTEHKYLLTDVFVSSTKKDKSARDS